MKINPISLVGNWEEGYALDYNVKSIEYLKENIFGYPEFEIEYTEIGKNLIEFKELEDLSKGRELAKVIGNFIKNEWKILDKIEGIISAPTTKNIPSDPLYKLVKMIGVDLKIPFSNSFFSKLTPDEIKKLSDEEKMNILKNNIKKDKTLKNRGSILLIDDFYNTGTTLKCISTLLREDINLDNIYVLTVVKNKDVE
ncbi:ComF family protein [Fusobacterium sp. PH5-44]|uniref:ComF family protein n=1 Tax=unclassified Fusobacterium TaxID=2648384 RepID=UPI003D1BF7B4